MERAFYDDDDLDKKGLPSRSTRWRMRKRGEFPNPVKISKGRVGYPAGLIDSWIERRSANGRDGWE